MTSIGGYCTNCGISSQAGQNFCGACGTSLSTPSAVRSAEVPTGSPVSRFNAAGPPGNDGRYPVEAVIGAVLLTIFMPFIALIAALVLRSQQMLPARREQLKNWAIASGAWLATGWVIGIIVFASAVSAISPSGCKGGIDQTVPPTYDSTDGKHWTGTFTCMNGGTITKPVPANQVPGGG